MPENFSTICLWKLTLNMSPDYKQSADREIASIVVLIWALARVLLYSKCENPNPRLVKIDTLLQISLTRQICINAGYNDHLSNTVTLLSVSLVAVMDMLHCITGLQTEILETIWTRRQVRGSNHCFISMFKGENRAKVSVVKF